MSQITDDSITNPMYRELVTFGAVNPAGVRVLNPQTRDASLPVLIDDTTGVIFLQRAETSIRYYEEEKVEDQDQGQTITTFADGSSVRTTPLEDDMRRFEQVKDLTRDKDICDFGCGYGGFLRLNLGHAKRPAGVELRANCRAHLKTIAPDVRLEKDILNFDAPFDLVTMFHVLEHIPTQAAVLCDIRRKLKTGGQIFVEVPHAGDFLIHTAGLQAFRDFTFWSEHLVLHTQASLTAVLKGAGFTDIRISGYQRYGFTNHLGWLVNGQPGGHQTFKNIERPDFQAAYNDYMAALGATDTLIAVARADGE